jgi:hypothetical protein
VYAEHVSSSLSKLCCPNHGHIQTCDMKSYYECAQDMRTTGTVISKLVLIYDLLFVDFVLLLVLLLEYMMYFDKMLW